MTGHPSSTPVNFENLFDALDPAVTPKWKQLAEVVRVDEDLIDEIFTNNNGIDEECLKDILKVWLKKSSPTWKSVADAVQKTGEDQLAESLYHKCKTHHSVFVLTLEFRASWVSGLNCIAACVFYLNFIEGAHFLVYLCPCFFFFLNLSVQTLSFHVLYVDAQPLLQHFTWCDCQSLYSD